MVQAKTELELEMSSASILILLFLVGGWVVGGQVGGLVLKLKLMLTQPPTELELELGLSQNQKCLHFPQRGEAWAAPLKQYLRKFLICFDFLNISRDFFILQNIEIF